MRKDSNSSNPKQQNNRVWNLLFNTRNQFSYNLSNAKLTEFINTPNSFKESDADAASLNITIPSVPSPFSNYYSQAKELTGLTPNNSYVVDVFAINEYGVSRLEAGPFTFITSTEGELCFGFHLLSFCVYGLFNVLYFLVFC